MAATKIDLARDLKELYTARREPALIDVPEFPFLMIDGHGDPNVSSEYRQAIEALYSLSYTLKFTLKRGPRQLDYRVMPLRGAVVGARHVGVLGHTEVRLGLDDDDPPAARG